MYRKKYNSKYNTRQEQKVYAIEKNDQSKMLKLFISKSYEKIDFEKKFDEKKSFDSYFYIITSNSSKICKKCDIKKKFFSQTIYFTVICENV